MKSPFRFVLVLTALAAVAPVQAQDAPIGTLTINSGTVMTSTGGEFASASSGEGVQAGERLMVSDGGNATINFTNGAAVTYTAPGVYIVNLPIVGAPVAGASTASTATTVGTILGAVITGTAAVESVGDDTPPESPVSR
jgi:hypothetical protein